MERGAHNARIDTPTFTTHPPPTVFIRSFPPKAIRALPFIPRDLAAWPKKFIGLCSLKHLQSTSSRWSVFSSSTEPPTWVSSPTIVFMYARSHISSVLLLALCKYMMAVPVMEMLCEHGRMAGLPPWQTGHVQAILHRFTHFSAEIPLVNLAIHSARLAHFVAQDPLHGKVVKSCCSNAPHIAKHRLSFVEFENSETVDFNVELVGQSLACRYRGNGLGRHGSTRI